MMWRIGIIVLILMSAFHVAFGGELPPPTPRKDRPVSDELYLRRIQQEWNNLAVATVNPNGNRRGRLGDMLLYNNAGSYKWCVNVSSGEGTTWRCDASALTAP